MAGRIELSFADVSGAPLPDTVDVTLRHHVLKEVVQVDGHDGTIRLAMTGLRTEPQGLYVLEVRSRCYRPVSRFVTIRGANQPPEVVTLPIRADRANAVFPDYDKLDDRVRGVLERSARVRGHEGITGRPLYDALDEEARAGLLNIAKKSLTMPFRDGADLLHHIAVLEVRRDRCFVELPQAVKNQVNELVDAEMLRPVNGSLHEPPAGFTPAGSFKTPDAFGNLQMTFFERRGECVADIDIDDAGGLGHVFQVMRNHLKREPTHPFDIHQILIAHQHLDPGYQLLPRPA